MYRSCIFCSSALGSNESIERFPVGRSLAFDAAKGRLWAVCPKCARWNLAPIEERWEAIEDAERLFRDTRLRAQSENIGLAKLRDGTRLIHVGAALPGELAAWRYGESLLRRRSQWLLRGLPLTVVGSALIGISVPAGVGGYVVWQATEMALSLGVRALRRRTVAVETRGEDGARVRVRVGHLKDASLAWHGDEMKVLVPLRPRAGVRRTLVLRGPDARMALGRAMTTVNAKGASRGTLREALGELERAGSAREFLRTMAWQRMGVIGLPDERARHVALEMAVHDETERRALQGELAMLEAMWRQAEEIAAIADRLPELPAPEPPRLAPES